MRFVIIIALVCIAISGCAAAPVSSNMTSGMPETTGTVHTDERCYLTQITDENYIRIKLPDDAMGYDDTVLSAIQEYAAYKLEEISGERFELTFSNTYLDSENYLYSEYWIDLEVTSSQLDEKTRSFIFEGMLSHRTSAHPINLRFALNLNVEQAEQIWFRNLYKIDCALYDTFATIAIQDIVDEAGAWPEGWGDFKTELCGEQKFLDGIRTEIGFSWYDADGGVYIIYPVPHMMGDYREVFIPDEMLRLTDD